ncbi:hypothetical protein NPIL_112371 [Nephila pilipes]|uniref:Uncharacterized protein n=1 Tax=Nephila pilipes TaxID=299642 RepID=A0A8X6N6V1_NEPPI|nr:hypothetical protein NPIL_112371 [Nephila pilipes]
MPTPRSHISSKREGEQTRGDTRLGRGLLSLFTIGLTLRRASEFSFHTKLVKASRTSREQEEKEFFSLAVQAKFELCALKGGTLPMPRGLHLSERDRQ